MAAAAHEQPALTTIFLVVSHTSEGQRRPEASKGERLKGSRPASDDEAEAGAPSASTAATATAVPAACHSPNDGPRHPRWSLASYSHGSEHDARPEARARPPAATHSVRTADAAAASTTADAAATKPADESSYGPHGGRSAWDDLVRILWLILVCLHRHLQRLIFFLGFSFALVYFSFIPCSLLSFITLDTRLHTYTSRSVYSFYDTWLTPLITHSLGTGTREPITQNNPQTRW